MNINHFEKIIKYEFKDKALLERALTHSSYNREKNTKHQDNERLEFLGDAFFDAIISAELFQKMKNVSEGKLTKTRALIVCESSLAQAGKKLGIGDFINMGHGEESAGGRNKDSIIADAMEAVIGAIFMDGGYENVKDFVVGIFSDTLAKAVNGKLFSDYKSEVQEVLQAKGTPVNLVYHTDREEGPAHQKTFYVHLECNDKILGRGIGKSKKEAEQNAAKATLERLERGDLPDVL